MLTVSISELTLCFLFVFLFYVASLSSTVDDGSHSATVTLAENASSDYAGQSEENLDAKVER